jgi:hypothetical protein
MAVLEEEFLDFSLFGARIPGAARAGRMGRGVEKRGALFPVRRVHARAMFQETANGNGAPRADRAMQWNRTSLVLVIDA